MLDPPILFHMYMWQQKRCFLCSVEMEPPRRLVAVRGAGGQMKLPGGRTATIDHIRPKHDCRGSSGGAANRALACRSCNNKKGDRKPTACERLFGRLICEAVLGFAALPTRQKLRLCGPFRVRRTRLQRMQEAMDVTA